MYSLGRYLQATKRWREIVVASKTVKPFMPVTLEYLGVGGLAYPSEIEANGATIRVEELEDTKVLWNIFVRHCYAVSPSDQVILDAGGNVGMFAIYAAHRASQARIFSVEPMPSTFERLTRNIGANNLSDRVATLNCAIAGATEERYFADESVPSAQMRLLSTTDDSARAGVRVSCRTIESLVDEFGLKSIDLVKMDIEGSEYEALFGTPSSVLRRIKRLIVELHRNPNTSKYRNDDLALYLKEGGLIQESIDLNHEGFGLAVFSSN